MVDGKYGVDIPQCPHKYINLSNLKYQNESKCATLSASCLYFAICASPLPRRH